MSFKEWIELKEDGPLPQTGRPVEEDLFRIIRGMFTPEEQAIVNQQKEELKKYGVVFTPFKFYGGMKNPRADVSSIK